MNPIEIIEYIVYYKLASKDFRCYNNVSNTIYNIERLPTDISNFYMTEKYKATDENLKQYSNDLYMESEQLKNSKIFKIDYITPYITPDGRIIPRTHFSNIENLFKMVCKGKYEHHEPIGNIEYMWFEKCYNAGLQFIKPGKYQCFGYDYKNYYGSIMASKEFKIPIKAGKERKFNKLPLKIYTGFYNVKITSDDINVKKIFAFSPEHVYTSLDLKFALELQKTFLINIELITDVNFNSYIYNLSNLENGYSIFNRWYQTILKLKGEFPKNALLKMLSSRLWGHLSRFNKKNMSEEQATIASNNNPDEYIIDSYITKLNGNSYYKLINAQKPYFYNLRLKPFITAFGRIKTAKVAMLDLDNIIKINTDGLVFTKEQNFNIDNLIPEEKSTGYLELVAINKPSIRL